MNPHRKSKISSLLLVAAFSLRFLNACGGGSGAGNPQIKATHFSVTAPGNVVAGKPFNITVTGLDASNNTVTTFSGTVGFTSSDAQSVLPAASTLANGTGTFSVTLMTPGSQTITATDTVGSITGTSNLISVSSVATHFSVTSPANATTGIAFSITVTALDGSNNTVTTYSGTVHFTSSDAQAVLPAASMLTNGSGTFSATLKTSGSQTITAADTVTASITGTSNSISVFGPATHFSISVPSNVTTGMAFNFTVTALDASNNVAPTYSGTIRFSSTDGQATLPANSPFSNGSSNFSATLKTLGGQTITATDTVTASITGTSSSISVGTNAPTHFFVETPGGASPGSAFNFAVSALDSANNLAPSYSGTIHFTSSDPLATLPANSTLTSGSGNFSAMLKTAGSQTITATDTVKASITGTSNSINIAQLIITSGQPPNGTVGVAYGPFHECGIEGGFSGFEPSASGGRGPYSWSGASLPPGLQVTQITVICLPIPVPHKVLLLHGVPTQAGNFNAVLTVTDSEVPAVQTSMTFTISISAAGAAKPAAVSNLDPPAKHHHYKLIDTGTLGGANSSLGFEGERDISNAGIAVSLAETTIPDPTCFFSDCFIGRAVQLRHDALTDLGALSSVINSGPAWISDSGIVSGFSENGVTDPLTGAPEFQAVLFQHGNVINLGSLGGNESVAFSVNNRGQAAGCAANAEPDAYRFCLGTPQRSRAFLWQDGAMKDLGTLGGPDALAELVNDRGQVAGWSLTDSSVNPATGIPTQHPFLWENGKMRDLGTIGGSAVQIVNIMNNQGQFVGGMNVAGDQSFHPFLWDGQSLKDIGTLGGDFGSANWINEPGDVVGWAFTVGNQASHAFLWQNEGLTDLGTVDGDPNSEAFVVNSTRQVVGATQDDNFNYAHAFLWERGSMADLNALIVPADQSLQLNAAVGLNERGEILAQGTLPNGDQHAFLLIPCDEGHPSVEGCDYSFYDGSEVTNAARPIPIAEGATVRKVNSSELTRSLHWHSALWQYAREKRPSR